MRPTLNSGTTFLRTVLLSLSTVLCVSAPAVAQDRDVLVFAAASLKNALDDIKAAWQRETGKKAVISYAGSNALAKQIEAGAPADLFFSADLDWMDYVASRGLIESGSRVNLLGNALVLIAPKDDAREMTIQPGFDLAGALKGGRLAMGNVDAVPAGKYGKAALEKLGAWNAVKDRIAQTDSVRAALLFVSRGEAALGIVYRTDATSDPGVRIVASFPEGMYPPIAYSVALTKVAGLNAKEFFDFLRSSQAKPLFERQGFSILAKPVSGS